MRSRNAVLFALAGAVSVLCLAPVWADITAQPGSVSAGGQSYSKVRAAIVGGPSVTNDTDMLSAALAPSANDVRFQIEALLITTSTLKVIVTPVNDSTGVAVTASQTTITLATLTGGTYYRGSTAVTFAGLGKYLVGTTTYRETYQFQLGTTSVVSRFVVTEWWGGATMARSTLDQPPTAHALLSASHSDTTAAAVARGAIVTGQGATPAWAKLTVGAASTLLGSDGTDVAWVASSTVMPFWATLVPGDIVYADAAGAPTRLPKGSDTQVLTLTSGLPSWAAAAAGGVSLDGAYDLGRTITADSGAVRVNKTSADANNGLEVLVTAGTGAGLAFPNGSTNTIDIQGPTDRNFRIEADAMTVPSSLTSSSGSSLNLETGDAGTIAVEAAALGGNIQFNPVPGVTKIGGTPPTIRAVGTGALKVGGGLASSPTSAGGDLQFQVATINSGTTAASTPWAIEATNGHIKPGGNGEFDIGSSTNTVRTVYAKGATIGTTGIEVSGNVTCTGALPWLKVGSTFSFYNDGGLGDLGSGVSINWKDNVSAFAGARDVGLDRLVVGSTTTVQITNGSTGYGALSLGRLYADYTIDTTAGDSATVNKAAGRFRKDTTGTAFTLTNSVITANSVIMLTPANAAIDVTATTWTVSAGAGSATITFNVAPTANFDMNFFVVSTD